MNLINKEYYVTRLDNLVYCGFYTLLKVAPVFCAGDHACEVKRNNPFIFKKLGNLAVGNFKSQALCYRGFAYTGFTDKTGVVFCTSDKNLNNSVNLVLSADDGVDLALFCHSG